jgi:hypothetical protein
MHSPRKPLSNTKDGQTDKDKSLNKDCSKGDLVWDHA